MLHATQIIMKPLLTEKSAWEGARHNRYHFQVHQDSDKLSIRKAIEEIYGVRVTSVATVTRKGKNRRTRYGWAYTGNWKKAIVELHPDDKIELL